MNTNTNTNTATLTAADVIDQIVEYFNDNPDTFTACIEELDGYNGYLNDDRYYSMDLIDEFYHDVDPLEFAARMFYGYDEDYYTDGSGNKIHDAFNPNRDYFRYNGYGNLVSTNYPDYSDHLDEYAIFSMLENRAYIDTIDNTPDLADLFDALEIARDNADENE